MTDFSAVYHERGKGPRSRRAPGRGPRVRFVPGVSYRNPSWCLGKRGAWHPPTISSAAIEPYLPAGATGRLLLACMAAAERSSKGTR